MFLTNVLIGNNMPSESKTFASAESSCLFVPKAFGWRVVNWKQVRWQSKKILNERSSQLLPTQRELKLLAAQTCHLRELAEQIVGAHPRRSYRWCQLLLAFGQIVYILLRFGFPERWMFHPLRRWRIDLATER